MLGGGEGETEGLRERPTGSGGGRDGRGRRMAARKEARRVWLAPRSASCLPGSVGGGGSFIIRPIETAGGRHSHAALDFIVSATVCMGEYFLVSPFMSMENVQSQREIFTLDEKLLINPLTAHKSSCTH